MNIESAADHQRGYFFDSHTLSYDFRIKQLKKIIQLIRDNEKEYGEALKKDLGKSFEQFYISELGVFYKEANKFTSKLKSWMKPRKVGDTLASFPSKNYIYPSPYGSSLVIAPWNYPFLLCFDPLIGSMAGGNCTVLKPSELTPSFSELTQRIINDNFDPKYLHVYTGGVEVSQKLLAQNFDHIFFTGSTQVGKIVMEAAAKHLTPVILELGGKSPCIVDASSGLEVAARRIAWGKFLNVGQTCVAPDYIVIEEKFQNDFINHFKNALSDFYGKNIKLSEDYGRIVSEKHFDRLVKLAIDSGYPEEAIESDRDSKYIAPIIISDTSWEAPVMQEEIFGPILPIIPVKNLSETINYIRKLPPPLALYYFGENKQLEEKIISSLRFGGGCINDTIVHLSNSNLSFGGVKESGIGRYHGKKSFDAFTYEKCIMKKSLMMDIPVRYPPLKNKLGIIKKVLG